MGWIYPLFEGNPVKEPRGKPSHRVNLRRETPFQRLRFLSQALQRQTAQLMGAALELEEEIQKEEAQHQAREQLVSNLFCW